MILCEKVEFNELDEYVYSIRKSNQLEYNDIFVTVIPPKGKLSLKMALKAPNLKIKSVIEGKISIYLKNVNDTHSVKIQSNFIIPELICLKELFSQEFNCNFIKLAAKKGKNKEIFKVFFKTPQINIINIDFDLIEIEKDDNFKCEVFHNSCSNTKNNNIMFLFVIFLQKNNNSYANNKFKYIILGKIKNSTVIFNFPLQIELY